MLPFVPVGPSQVPSSVTMIELLIENDQPIMFCSGTTSEVPPVKLSAIVSPRVRRGQQAISAATTVGASRRKYRGETFKAGALRFIGSVIRLEIETHLSLVRSFRSSLTTYESRFQP